MSKTHSSILLSLGVVALAACSEPTPALEKAETRPVKLFTITSPQDTTVRKFPGSVVASEAAELSFRVSGTLQELSDREGAAVSKGDILARLESNDAANSIREAQAEYERASSEEKRRRSLMEQGILSRGTYETTLSNLRTAEAALAAARDGLSYTVLRAPFDGIISDVQVDNFQFVQAREAVLSIENQDYIDISIEMPERDIISITEDETPSGYQPEVVFPSLGDQVFRASYKESSTEPTPGTQTYTVVVTMPRPEGARILQGMTAQLTVDFSQVSRIDPDGGYVTVPLIGVVYPDADGGAVPAVWRFDADAGTVIKTEVTLGDLTNDGVAILTGLEPGDQIVIAGLDRLQDGQTVKPWERESGL